MKRYGYLYERAFSKENLLEAYLDAREDKRDTRAVLNFERRLAFNLGLLYEELWGERYTPRPPYEFVVYEPKRRVIRAPAFRDHVAQHAIYRVIYPIFNSTFIDQSFACRKGMGTHRAADYAQQALKRSPPDSCVLKMDVRKFFASIDRQVLLKQLSRRIKDARLLDLIMTYAEGGDGGGTAGLPIGALLSQLDSLINLNPLDHYIKRELKVKIYCRYMDDFIVFGLPRKDCEDLQVEIEGFLQSQLNLQLSKWSITTIPRGLNFVGYRTWASRRFIRKHSMYKFRRALKRGDIDAVVSILGHARNTHTHKRLVKEAQEHCHANNLQLPKVYRPTAHHRAQVTAAVG